MSVPSSGGLSISDYYVSWGKTSSVEDSTGTSITSAITASSSSSALASASVSASTAASSSSSSSLPLSSSLRPSSQDIPVTGTALTLASTTSCYPEGRILNITRTVVHTRTVQRITHHRTCRCAGAPSAMPSGMIFGTASTLANSSSQSVVPVSSMLNQSSAWSSPSLSPVATYSSEASQARVLTTLTALWLTMGMILSRHYMSFGSQY